MRLFFFLKDIQITKVNEEARTDKASESKDGIPVFFPELASKAEPIRVHLHQKQTMWKVFPCIIGALAMT